MTQEGHHSLPAASKTDYLPPGGRWAGERAPGHTKGPRESEHVAADGASVSSAHLFRLREAWTSWALPFASLMFCCSCLTLSSYC